MKILCDNWDTFLKNCKLFYTDKKIEIIRVFEVEHRDNKVFIGNEIQIPNSAIITKSGRVSISVKFLTYVFQNLSKKKKGFLIVHNHDTQCEPSPADTRTFQAMKKFINYFNIQPYIFVIYSNVETYFKIVFGNDEKEFYISNN